MTHALDQTDILLLEVLQKDASLPGKQLAALCGVSEATCSRRIKALVKSGHIKKHTVLLDRKKLGFTLSVHVLVAMESEHLDKVNPFVNRLKKIPEVLTIDLISGEYTYILYVVARDMQHYNDFAESYLVDSPNVKKYLSLFELKPIKHETALPINR